jgi:general nucleoside transport system permease protein
MSMQLLLSVLTAAVVTGTTFLLASLGALLNERVGILNLGVEGMMLTGAVSGFMVAHSTHSPWLGALAAMVAGALLAAIHAFLTIGLRANQVGSGLALTIFGGGFSAYMGRSLAGQPLTTPFKAVAIPLLAKIPVLGEILFHQNPLVYLGYILVPLLWWWLYRTRPGLSLRAVGENPAAADAVGIRVARTRYLYVMLGGALCGLAGAHLSIAVTPNWVEGMTAGRGWVAVALVIFAGWDPVRAAGGALLFGGVEALAPRLQAAGVTLPPAILAMAPYLLTIVALAFASRGRSRIPGALGLAYDRESR